LPNRVATRCSKRAEARGPVPSVGVSPLSADGTADLAENISAPLVANQELTA